MLQKISLIFHFQNNFRNFAIQIVQKIGRFIQFRLALQSMPHVLICVDFHYECSEDCLGKNQKTKIFGSKFSSVYTLSKTGVSLLHSCISFRAAVSFTASVLGALVFFPLLFSETLTTKEACFSVEHSIEQEDVKNLPDVLGEEGFNCSCGVSIMKGSGCLRKSGM